MAVNFICFLEGFQKKGRIMRSKKTLALLLAASMVFTMNTSIFAGVKAASDDDGKVITQSSPDSHSPDEKDDPSGPDTPSGPDIPDIPDTPNKTVSEGEISKPDKDGKSTIDVFKDTNDAGLSTSELNKFL
ncbi:MAG: hypothetical protein K6G84_12375, partial [Lachnospiraceae bacterium]|nr:hypothetical protein [Lachnospiraceae bacterium]